MPRPHLTFRVDDRLHAVDAAAVREILRLPELTPVAEAPPAVVGVINLRGRVLPVLDLGQQLHYPSRPLRLEDGVIVVETTDGLLGVLVNDVCDVTMIDESQREPPPFPAAALADNGRLVVGLARIGPDIAVLLDLEALRSLAGLAPAARLPAPLPTGRAPELEGAAVEPAPGGPSAPAPVRPQALDPEAIAIFRQRALDLQAPVGMEADQETMPLAVVQLSGETYAIDLDTVREFAAMREVTPVPCCPPHILGQMNLRGEIVTLIDIRPAIDLPVAGAAGSGKMVVVRIGELLAGVPVDEIVDILHLRPGDVMAVPTAVHSAGPGFLQGTARYRDQTVSLLDLAGILTRGEMVVNEEP